MNVKISSNIIRVKTKSKVDFCSKATQHFHFLCDHCQQSLPMLILLPLVVTLVLSKLRLCRTKEYLIVSSEKLFHLSSLKSLNTACLFEDPSIKLCNCAIIPNVLLEVVMLLATSINTR